MLPFWGARVLEKGINSKVFGTFGTYEKSISGSLCGTRDFGTFEGIGGASHRKKGNYDYLDYLESGPI